MMSRQADPTAIWQRVKRMLVQQLQSPTPAVWQAIDALVPLGFDGNEFILGCPYEHAPLMPHVTAPTTKNLLDKILQQLLGEDIQSKIIQGRNWEDYERYKEMMVVRQRLEQQRAMTAITGVAAEKTWRELWQRLSQQFHRMTHRQYESTRARFILEAAAQIAEFAEEEECKEGANIDLIKREIDRVIERLASLLGVPMSVVAIEVERCRKAKVEQLQVTKASQ
ncbi:MAG: hypothetical protein RMK18_03210 [Armatimonadota bacterium]|nr:hypothetical protein [Armatimonadota bacterium]MCX7777071.1 hypothetical protein [Armatimonadota bacterium]MDW8024859.1 hypothetical protein [Armatimonadota bacterium]